MTAVATSAGTGAVPVAERLARPARLHIAGAWRAAGDGATFTVESPATGAVVAAVANATPDDGRLALDAACAAQAHWAGTSPSRRSEILRSACDALLLETEAFARLIALETGKPIAEARAEVTYAAGYLRWFSEEAVRIQGRLQPAPGGGATHLVTRRPVGPCLLITPWNFPLAMVTRKVAPAVASGCTMVLKPAEATPLTAALLVELMQDAGLPDGVLNLLTTDRSAEVVSPLLADPRLRKLSFTGSTRVGRLLLAAAADRVLRCSMELGGNAPFIVFEDADLDAAVEGVAQAKLRNAGQACTAANRVFVHAPIADRFIDKLARRFRDLRPDAEDPAGPTLGPLISRQARSRVDAIVRDALDRGASLVTGGAIPDGPGCFYPATLLADVPMEAAAMQTEIFGPVAPLHRFEDEDHAIALANASEHGLAAYGYTRDLGRAFRLQDRLEAGMLGINTGIVSDPAAPFGGVKQSGLGREGGREGIEEYLTTHYAAFVTAT